MKKISFVIIALIFISCGYGYSQSKQTEQTMQKNISQEDLIENLVKRISGIGNDYVSLTEAEYELLLSQPLGEIEKFEPLTTASGGIMIGIGSLEGGSDFTTDIQTIFPYIPNLSQGGVFIIFEYVKGSNGLDYLDRENNTEIQEDGSYPENDYTQLSMAYRSDGSKSYFFGFRFVNLRDPADRLTQRVLGALGGKVELSKVSGKVVMELPTNITELGLSKADIGIEKSLAGGLIILKEITKDYISFQFTGDRKKLFPWEVYDKKGWSLTITDEQIDEGLYKLYAEHPQSMRIYQAEVVRKEYPFFFDSKRRDAQEKVTPAASAEIATVAPAEVATVEPLVYLEPNDPIATVIKARAVNDLKQSVDRSDTESAENKLIAAQIEAWPQEKQNQLQEIFVKSINDYLIQTHFDVTVFNYGTFIMLYSDLGKMDQKSLTRENDIRVQNLGGNKYVAEFWEDSQAHALALEGNPNTEDIEIFKELIRLSRGQKSVTKEDGATTTSMVASRYTKMLGLLYSLEKDGSLTFHDPFQPMMDFIKR